MRSHDANSILSTSNFGILFVLSSGLADDISVKLQRCCESTCATLLVEMLREYPVRPKLEKLLTYEIQKRNWVRLLRDTSDILEILLRNVGWFYRVDCGIYFFNFWFFRDLNIFSFRLDPLLEHLKINFLTFDKFFELLSIHGGTETVHIVNVVIKDDKILRELNSSPALRKLHLLKHWFLLLRSRVGIFFIKLKIHNI